MNKQQIIIKINQLKGILIGSTRPQKNVQLDKWFIATNAQTYLITSKEQRTDRQLNFNPKYTMEDKVELLTEIL